MKDRLKNLLNKIPSKPIYVISSILMVVALALALLAIYFNFFHCNNKYSSYISKEATCTENGIKTFTCKKCGDTYTEKIKAGSMWKHNYVEKVTKEATCTENGEKTFTCEKCQDTYTEEIEAGHKWAKATCESPKTCLKCGKTSGEKTEHEYSGNGVCKNCKAKFISLDNKLPEEFGYYNYSNDYCYSKCKITDVTFKKCGYDDFDITFNGICTYNRDGNSQSSSMYVGWKLYDSKNVVVDSGTMSSANVAVGEKFTKDISIYDLDINETYKLVLSNVN